VKREGKFLQILVNVGDLTVMGSVVTLYRPMQMEMDACLCMIRWGVVISLGQPGSGG
jgi:hypothetical protein